MTTGRLILRSLRFYARTHLGVVLGIALASAILTGALAVGDSVRHTLQLQAMARLGRTVQALVSPENFFRAELAAAVASSSQADAAPALLLRGTVVRPDGTARANGIQVVGADASFWRMGGMADPLADAEAGDAVINARLARQLGVSTGEVAVVRVEMPSLVSRDAPLSGRSDLTASLRVRIRAILDDDGFGRFGLQASQVPPANLFLPLATLQENVQRPGRANLILSAATGELAPSLAASWSLVDAGLECRALPEGRSVELRTDRVFLDQAVVAAASSLVTNTVGVLTYFANEIRLGSNATPYSFVAATGATLRDDEIAIDAWLADDLQARVGDAIELRYFAIGDRRELSETSATFRVAAIYPTKTDASWMPAFPGLAEINDCRKWEPGIPIDTERIRPKDETYWNEHSGTPKAFISLAAGQKLWANRFGALTAIRLPGGGDPTSFAAALRERIDPASVGLHFSPVRDWAQKAGGQALDFGQLFLSLSFFLIAAALALSAMLFVFSLEQRHTEAGLLRALGFTEWHIRRLMLTEGALLAVIGASLGALPGLGYTKLALMGLSSVWGAAAGGIPFHFKTEPSSLAIGAVSTCLAALLAMGWAQRRQFRRPVAELLARGAELETPTGRMRAWIGPAVLSAGLVATLALAWTLKGKTGMDAAGGFFGAGACALLAGLGFIHWFLSRMARTSRTAQSLNAIGLRAMARRPGRCLTSIGVLASGLFLVIAISAFHHDAQQGGQGRTSGTGGFALFARSALPIHDNLNTPAGRGVFGIDEVAANGVSVVPLRVQAGDEASCLNLNRAQQPVLWGVDPEELQSRRAFSFVGGTGTWSMLDVPAEDGVVPAIGDQQSVQWALGRKTGDLVACTDGNGRTFHVKIVATVAASILQGGLLISERHFVARFPSAAGSRLFLIDTPPNRADEVAKEWTRALGDRGFEATPAWQRLAEFQAVENTYLAIFQALGGLGVLLGSAGFGIVAARNGMERRRELAAMLALGFRRTSLQGMLFVEQIVAVFFGLGIACTAALVAVARPHELLRDSIPLSLLAWTLGGLLTVATVSIWFAVRAPLRGSVVAALRND